MLYYIIILYYKGIVSLVNRLRAEQLVNIFFSILGIVREVFRSTKYLRGPIFLSVATAVTFSGNYVGGAWMRSLASLWFRRWQCVVLSRPSCFRLYNVHRKNLVAYWNVLCRTQERLLILGYISTFFFAVSFLEVIQSKAVTAAKW
jgi:hypothetical protein